MPKPDLRIVDATSTAKPRKVMSLAEAVESGEYLEILRAQRREIAESLPDEKGPAKAALHRQLSLIAKEIEAIETRAEKEDESRAAVADEDFDAEAI